MRSARFLLVILLAAVVAVWPEGAAARTGPKPAKPWRALHVLNYNTDTELDGLAQNLVTLAEMGVNVLILEVDYNFAFKSHPELRHGTNPITRAGARRFAASRSRASWRCAASTKCRSLACWVPALAV